MSIQEHLNKIRNAVYGHEVRESIAKGIETAYDDASENGNANMEVKAARGTHPNLRSRLEEINTLASDKADKTELENTNSVVISKADKTYVDDKLNDISVAQINKNKGLLDETYFSDQVKQQWTGNTPVNATPPDGGVTKAKLADKSVSVEKTDDIVGLNMYPFHRRATINADQTYGKAVLSAVKDIKLTGANPNEQYRITTLSKYYSSSVSNFIYQIIITNSSGVDVARFLVNNGYTEPVGFTWITLDERNGSGITAKVWIDWGKLPEDIRLSSLTYEQTGLDERTYTYELMSLTGDVTKERLPSEIVTADKVFSTIGFNMYPFHRRALIYSDKTTALQIINAVKNVTLFNANKNVKYHLHGLFRGRYSSTNKDYTWWFSVRDETQEVCRFITQTYNDPNGVAKVELESLNNSGVTGVAWIDWSALPNGFSLTNTTYEQTGFDDRVHSELVEQHPTHLVQTGENIRNLRSNFLQNFDVSLPKIHDKQDYNTLSFSVITDSHLDPPNKIDESTKLILEATSALTEYADLDFIAMTGDYIIGDLPKAESLKLMNDTMFLTKAHAKCPVYAIRGNHDSNEMQPDFNSLTDQEKREALITNKEFHQAVTRKCERYGIVVDPLNPYGGYYYVEFPRQKIRAVFLNTTEMNEDENGVLNMPNYVYRGVQHQKQLDWLTNIALKIDKDDSEEWATVIFSHIPPITEAFHHNYGIARPNLVNIIKAFKEGTSGMTEDSTATIHYDFTQQGARELIGHFMGHVHDDCYAEVGGINYFISTCTGASKKYESSPDRERYGLNALSLNTFVINRNTRTVSVVKTGSGNDFEFTW